MNAFLITLTILTIFILWLIFLMRNAMVDPYFDNKFKTPPGVASTYYPPKPYKNFNTWTAYIKKENDKFRKNR